MKKSVWRKRVNRILMGTAVFLLLLAFTGVVYQVMGTKADQRAYAPPGQMVDVGGYQLHIYCMGEGSPTVILDHAGGTNSAEWGLVQPIVAGQTRVCAYDRAGFGWSDPAPTRRTAAQNAQELRTLLNNAGLEGPFVFVGHSYGANVARVFAAEFPAESAGLVLVDPGIVYGRPGVPADLDEIWRTADTGFMNIAPWLARLGVVRLAGALGGLPGRGDLPAGAFDAWQQTNLFYDTLKAQNQGMAETSTQVLAAEAQLVDELLLVLSAGEPAGAESRDVWTAVNATLATYSATGTHQVVSGADHMSLTMNQEYAQVTANAILEMVAIVRGTAVATID
ncbi:MAG: alpha/beta hydrolase [Anaerolineaceae bacterium]|nr:alpha/beta hydrolase [Anaerolineaceae bacterium]